MMDEETHVDSTSSGEQADICQVLLDSIEDQSEVCGRAVKETAISGLSQSNQLRLGNVPNDENISVDSNYNSNKENFDAANYNVPNVLIYPQVLFPKFEEDRYGDLSLFTTSYFKPHKSMCATYLWTEENKFTIMESEAYDINGNNMWFKQGWFTINLQAESQSELMDGTNIVK